MVENRVCDSCSAPMAPDDTFCPRCGAAAPAAQAPIEPTSDPGLAVRVAPGRAAETDDIARQSARDAAAWAAAVARDAAAGAVAERAAADRSAAATSDRDSESEPEPAVEASPTTDPEPDGSSGVSDRFLTPSATNRTLGSIGGGRPGDSIAIAPAAPAAVAPAASAAVAPAPPPAALSPAVPERTPTQPATPSTPNAAPTTWQRVKTILVSMAAEPKSELAATVLTALGGALVLVGFVGPWTPENGIGIGTIDPNPRPGAWGFDTPAGWPLFLISAIMMALILGSDKLEELLPALASTIRRLTEVVVPMFLGALLLGAAFMYLTLPWGSGGGISFLALGAVLLIAGSVVGLFFPAGERKA